MLGKPAGDAETAAVQEVASQTAGLMPADLAALVADAGSAALLQVCQPPSIAGCRLASICVKLMLGYSNCMQNTLLSQRKQATAMLTSATVSQVIWSCLQQLKPSCSLAGNISCLT